MARTVKSESRSEVAAGRRKSEDRRKSEKPVKVERRKTQRRRQIDPTTCERDYSDEEIEFMQALDDYKRKSGRMFPTCSEILEVVRALGYVRLAPGVHIQEVDDESHAENEADEAVEKAGDAEVVVAQE